LEDRGRAVPVLVCWTWHQVRGPFDEAMRATGARVIRLPVCLRRGGPRAECCVSTRTNRSWWRTASSSPSNPF